MWELIVKIKSNLEGDKSKFERIYICLAATKKGFIDALRPVVGLDACHIKGQHPGQLLYVVGVDPNNGMYPIAYAVAEAENYATWTWSLELLAVDLGIENPQLLLSYSRTPNVIFNFSLCPQQPSHQSSFTGRHFDINPYKKPTTVFPLCIKTTIPSHSHNF
ncbi:uncharacterized protein Pyn_00023 [Prunus yedoensis var. nudiflora]|uniref:MULE transposase domain-containing protein n=1 Tax=Prunus yedoensis var. nudiflora TaxID=2094558 RepID=A0A314UZT5_PRUYE|nr:uncharacterized protein Pyn_00023 [Prunus yedoensis var. nudiflora]